MGYLFKLVPGLRERRMQDTENLKEQGLIIGLGWFLFLFTFILVFSQRGRLRLQDRGSGSRQNVEFV